MPTYFVRVGGCDYRCSWCDSKHAVDPVLVRRDAEKLTYEQIMARLWSLGAGPQWVTISGGNPALLDLTDLVFHLHLAKMKVAVETQGSKWQDWLRAVDCLTVSPKPPSSGMAGKTEKQLSKFMDKVDPSLGDALKIVVFDDADYEWAREVFQAYPQWPAFISAGTDTISGWGSEVLKGVNERQARDEIGERYAWLCEKASVDKAMAHVRVLPQLHVIAWGHAKGV